MKKKTVKNLQAAIRAAKKGNSRRGLALCEEILARGNDNAHVRFVLALVHWHGDDLDKALVEAQHACKLEPENSEYLETLGSLLGTLERYPEAITAFQNSIASDHKNHKAHLHLGRTRMSMDEVNEAAQSFVVAARLAPKNDEAWVDLGEALRRLDHINDAIECFKKAHRLSPSTVEYSLRLAKLLQTDNRAEEANTYFKAVLKVDPTHPIAKAALKSKPKASSSFDIGKSLGLTLDI